MCASTSLKCKQRKTRYSQKQKKTHTHPSCTRQECDRSVNGSQGGRGRRGDDVEGRQRWKEGKLEEEEMNWKESRCEREVEVEEIQK